MIPVLLMLLGLVVLVAGAELLVRGAASIAAVAGISPLVIGLTVVAFGTSAPELAVSVNAGLSGQADIALGNVVGSNIFNVLFILGVSALIAPLAVALQLVRLDVPIMIGASLLLWFLARDGLVGRLEGAFLFVLLIAYTAGLIYLARRAERKDADLAELNPARPLWQSVAFVIAGLVLLVLGARWLVDGAVTVAQHLGVSELIIGLTIVAAGTSLPELATSCVASFRGERDIAVGNVVGSNIFNILCVLGLSSVLAPGGVPVAAGALAFDLPVMVCVAVACLPIFITGSMVSRIEGALFVVYYAGYTAVLILLAMASPLVDQLNAILLYFALPGTALILFTSLFLSEKRLTVALNALPEDALALAGAALQHGRKVVIFVTGATLMLVGVAMLVLPGPGWLTIGLGLAVLATEFIWAKRLLNRLQDQLKSAVNYMQGGDKQDK